MQIKGSVALITGGANGIGECCAKALASAGAKVSICDILPDQIDRVVKEIRAAGGRGHRRPRQRGEGGGPGPVHHRKPSKPSASSTS